MAILIRKVTLRNYKSIAECNVDLSELSLLVGPNGSGKSNFVDAIRLVAEGLNSTLEYAIRHRGGIGEVRRRSGGHPNHFAVGLRINLGSGRNALFAFQVGAQEKGGFNVQHEKAVISGRDLDASYYEIENGNITKSSPEISSRPKIVPDRFFLTAVSGISSFRPLYDALSTMGFYNVNPTQIKEPQPHDPGELLTHSGSNVAAVIKRLEAENTQAKERIEQYLRQVVPGLEAV